MEPQIIDYYNETPHGINVIDKLNEEYSELQSKYDTIKSITDRYIAPIHIAKTFDEYKKYEKILNEEFPEKIREILNDKEYGLLKILKIRGFSDCLYTRCLYTRFKFLQNPEREFFIDKIVNELDNITKNKNRKWCEDRIDLALEICLSKYDTINDKNSEEIIDDLINHIVNDWDDLTSFYIETIEFYTNENLDTQYMWAHEKWSFGSLSELHFYHCEKCKRLDYNILWGYNLPHTEKPPVKHGYCLDCWEMGRLLIGENNFMVGATEKAHCIAGNNLRT